jgi:hypothetical protein
MSNLIKTTLKELSEDLNSIQSKKKEMTKKYEFQSRIKLFQEIKKMKQKIMDSVYTSISYLN